MVKDYHDPPTHLPGEINYSLIVKSLVINEILKMVGHCLLSYTKIIKNRGNLTDMCIPPSKEEVKFEYQNNPLFNRTVDTITHKVIEILKKGGD